MFDIKNEFFNLITIQDTAIRRLGIISEAVKNLSDFSKNKY